MAAKRNAQPDAPVAVVVVIYTVVDGDLQALLVHRSAAPQDDRSLAPSATLSPSRRLPAAV